jgi:hypothetical protein
VLLETPRLRPLHVRGPRDVTAPAAAAPVETRGGAAGKACVQPARLDIVVFRALAVGVGVCSGARARAWPVDGPHGREAADNGLCRCLACGHAERVA